MSDIPLHQIVERSPTPQEYAELRAAAGWDAVAPEAVERGLDNSLYSACALDGERVVGCARIVGDGGLYFYLQDVIVLPGYQGRGVGSALTERLMEFLRRTARSGSFVGLMAAEGVAGFYERFGFRERPEERPGMYRVWSGEDGADEEEGGM